MNGRPEPGGPRPGSRVAGFRTRLLVAMTAVIFAAAAGVLYLAEQRLAANAEQAFELQFRGALAGLHDADRIRQAVMAGRCRELARRPRIHAALEDGAEDLLYPSARDELADLMAPDPSNPALLGVQFCRFLGPDGAPIRPAAADAVGRLTPAEEAALGMQALPARQEIGYVGRSGGGVAEVILTPIISGDTGEVIAALALGFEPGQPALGDERRVRTGLWLGGRLHLSSGSLPVGGALGPAVNAALAGPAPPAEASFRLSVAGEPCLIFCKSLNPGSAFPAAYEICACSLAEVAERQRHLRWEMLGAAAVVLLGAFGVGEVLSLRFSSPVEKLAAESERSARFSADASHQLKTPVTVLRAGLEELLAGERLTPEECAQISALIHQTYRLSSLIDDLLLLARMDAGRLKLERAPVALRELLDACTDDFSAMPDPNMPEIESRLEGELEVSGERRYLAMILHNLLENSRKYNRPDGRIRIEGREDGRLVCLRIGNSGPGIPLEAQAQLFERFRRGRQGEAVPGYGLGLNLARELARLHGGDLRLVSSNGDWTEFELTLERAEPPVP